MTQDPQPPGWFPQEPTQGQPGYGPPPAPGAPPAPQPDQSGYSQPASYGQPTGYGPPAGYAGGPPAPPVGYGYGYLGAPDTPQAPAPTSAIVLLVVSGLLTLVLFWTVVGFTYAAPAVLAIVSMTRARTDAAGSRRLARIGWLVFGIISVLMVVVVIGLVVFFAAIGGADSGGYDGTSI